jgi:hypothetical protein
MPTHDERAQFLREFAALSPAQRPRFLDALRKMVNDLKARQPFRPGLRIKGVRDYPGIFEMSWSGDGRATFQYGPEVRPGEPHIIWRRIGGHEIFDQP